MLTLINTYKNEKYKLRCYIINNESLSIHLYINVVNQTDTYKIQNKIHIMYLIDSTYYVFNR